ncbi:MAG: type II toxin-antitoxin system RelE/ParE family toxin [Gemmatimonadales bacterium]
MAGYSLLIKPSAVKELEALPRKDRSRVVGRIQALATAPRPQGCEKLSGEEKYRVRQGEYRVLYAIDDKAGEVVVVKIGHRRDVYR